MKPLIVNSPLDITLSHLFYQFESFVSQSDLFLKLEGVNLSGSIKIKPAIEMVESLEAKGKLDPAKNTIIESSSGSLGIALSIVCKIKGYKFICISDPNINEISKKYINLYGGDLIIVEKRDENGGFLNTRIRLIKKLVSQNPNMVWLNQYASLHNVNSHFGKTAVEIFESINNIDLLFVGVGTSGTLMGCAKYILENKLNTRLIAVDAEGSVTFGLPSGKRLIPGLGTSRKPEILDPNVIDDLVIVPETQTIGMCREILDKHGLFVGGSTGTVLAAIKAYKNKIPISSKLVAISPDFGDRYLDTIFNDHWVNNNFSTSRDDSSKTVQVNTAEISLLENAH